ncbi:MAG: SRPBCC family protein [Actinomycetota bacterium]|nr:SRPBCC family protein [Actinomycetota bacterium]
MADHDGSIDVQAPAQQLFDYLSDVRHLPDYFAAMVSADPAHGEAVHVVAEVNGSREEGEAWFRVDEVAKRLQWGSEGTGGYRGLLDVTGDTHTSTVTVKLHTEHGAADQINEGISATLAEVKRLVETGPAPSAS